jgi:hypothetical protein
MEHDWILSHEIHGNVIVKCKLCGYLTSAGYWTSPNYDWFVVGRIMSCFNSGSMEYRAIPKCEEFLAEVVHDR